MKDLRHRVTSGSEIRTTLKVSLQSVATPWPLVFSLIHFCSLDIYNLKLQRAIVSS